MGYWHVTAIKSVSPIHRLQVSNEGLFCLTGSSQRDPAGAHSISIKQNLAQQETVPHRGALTISGRHLHRSPPVRKVHLVLAREHHVRWCLSGRRRSIAAPW